MPYLLYASTTPNALSSERGPSGNENGLRRRVEYESHIWLRSASIWLDWALSLFTKRYDAIKTQHKWASPGTVGTLLLYTDISGRMINRLIFSHFERRRQITMPAWPINRRFPSRHSQNTGSQQHCQWIVHIVNFK